jgi:hypothetical protein
LTPSVGRIVHVADAGGQHQAAIISKVWEGGDTVNALVIRESGTSSPMTSIQHVEETGAEATPYVSWHWPERVE